LLAEARRLLAEASGGSGGGANGNTANNLLAEARRLAEAGDGNGGFVGQIGEGASTRNLAAIAALADRLATEGEEIAGTSTATGTSLINQRATAVGGFGLPSGWPARAGLIIIVLIILYLLYGFYRNRMGT
ncbi:MAG: hypothetical protein NTY66_00685, partial [Candidatus Vogelbacteria bacterium]|nr:hypothetical protein [Candidatus Vogelbacteria bacterium]